MTLAMMLPSSLPMAQIFVQVAQRQPRARIVFGLFLLGYFAVWTGFAVVALAGDTGLHWLVDQWSWLDRRQWLIEGSVLTLAGVFQFSPLKERCLDACRDPFPFSGATTPGVRLRPGAWASRTVCTASAVAGR
jgi:predicted metal-binding membrane protein